VLYSEENLTVMVYCVMRVGKGQSNDLLFKTSYKICECKCVNVTSSEVRFSSVCFRMCN